MTRLEARDALRALVQATVTPTLSDADLDAVLDLSQVPDSMGVWPGQTSYIPTWDLYWAAAEAMLLRATRAAIDTASTGAVESFSSEGTTFRIVTSTSWGEVADWFRRRSQIWAALEAAKQGVPLRAVQLPPVVRYTPTSGGPTWA